jgi:CheY-like chemotaxis protein
MDIMMPGMDGYAAIRTIHTIRQSRGLQDLPIVALTGKVVAGERQRCIDAGANGYVPKPVNTVELIAAITPWLRNTLEPSSGHRRGSLPSTRWRPSVGARRAGSRSIF